MLALKHICQSGLRQRLLDGIELALELRLGVDGLQLLPETIRIDDVGVLKAVHNGIRSAARLEELRLSCAADEP